jgi:hypothetical protein
VRGGLRGGAGAAALADRRPSPPAPGALPGTRSHHPPSCPTPPSRSPCARGPPPGAAARRQPARRAPSVRRPNKGKGKPRTPLLPVTDSLAPHLPFLFSPQRNTQHYAAIVLTTPGRPFNAHGELGFGQTGQQRSMATAATWHRCVETGLWAAAAAAAAPSAAATQRPGRAKRRARRALGNRDSRDGGSGLRRELGDGAGRAPCASRPQTRRGAGSRV